MEYKVHQLNIDMGIDKTKLELFLNNLKGEIISIIPSMAKTSLPQIFGVTSKNDFLLVVEKIIKQ